MKDGKPDLVNYELRDGTYIIPKVMDSGYVELGKKRMDFARKPAPHLTFVVLGGNGAIRHSVSG
jgi:hypothetical protein